MDNISRDNLIDIFRYIWYMIPILRCVCKTWFNIINETEKSNTPLNIGNILSKSLNWENDLLYLKLFDEYLPKVNIINDKRQRCFYHIRQKNTNSAADESHFKNQFIIDSFLNTAQKYISMFLPKKSPTLGVLPVSLAAELESYTLKAEFIEKKLYKKDLLIDDNFIKKIFPTRGFDTFSLLRTDACNYEEYIINDIVKICIAYGCFNLANYFHYERCENQKIETDLSKDKISFDKNYNSQALHHEDILLVTKLDSYYQSDNYPKNDEYKHKSSCDFCNKSLWKIVFKTGTLQDIRTFFKIMKCDDIKAADFINFNYQQHLIVNATKGYIINYDSDKMKEVLKLILEFLPSELRFFEIKNIIKNNLPCLGYDDKFYSGGNSKDTFLIEKLSNNYKYNITIYKDITSAVISAADLQHKRKVEKYIKEELVKSLIYYLSCKNIKNFSIKDDKNFIKKYIEDIGFSYEEILKMIEISK
jgi:hypothetical protein